MAKHHGWHPTPQDQSVRAVMLVYHSCGPLLGIVRGSVHHMDGDTCVAFGKSPGKGSRCLTWPARRCAAASTGHSLPVLGAHQCGHHPFTADGTIELGVQKSKGLFDCFPCDVETPSPGRKCSVVTIDQIDKSNHARSTVDATKHGGQFDFSCRGGRGAQRNSHGRVTKILGGEPVESVIRVQVHGFEHLEENGVVGADQRKVHRVCTLEHKPRTARSTWYSLLSRCR